MPGRAPSGATVYWLEVNTDPARGTSSRFYYAQVSSNSKALMGFPNNGTTCYRRVWAGNAAG